jgi:hypothetical protein
LEAIFFLFKQTEPYELFFPTLGFFGWLKISIWFEYVNQKNKLEEDLEEVTNKVFFDIKIGGKDMGMVFVGLCV